MKTTEYLELSIDPHEELTQELHGVSQEELCSEERVAHAWLEALTRKLTPKSRVFLEAYIQEHWHE